MAGDYDVAIIGGGPNGLTAAAYLARSGADVVVLEQRFERGGTMASDDYSTPFTYNQAQAALPLGADNPVVGDLALADHGVAFIEPGVCVEVITPDGEHTVGRGDLRRRFATTGAGTVRQGSLRPGQTLNLRPHPQCADTRTPVPGFYLGGGGVHPGVPGLLSAGMMAARALRADHRLAVTPVPQ